MQVVNPIPELLDIMNADGPRQLAKGKFPFGNNHPAILWPKGCVSALLFSGQRRGRRLKSRAARPGLILLQLSLVFGPAFVIEPINIDLQKNILIQIVP